MNQRSHTSLGMYPCLIWLICSGLAPSNSHLPVRRYVHPDTFKMFEEQAYAMGFTHAAVGAMVRSSYHADQQAHSAQQRMSES